MAEVDMKALLEAGVHFGHRTQKWNPKMKQYIFTERNGIHIIDLQQTAQALGKAYDLVRDKVAEGGVVLFTGTKRQAVDTIQSEAVRAEMPYVTVRWLGGMLTNWQTMRQRINELERLERMREKGDFDLLTKREALSLTRKIDKLEDRFGGIRDINRQPDMLFVVDVRREETAVREANILGIPVVGLVDTNCDPSVVDHVIPSNDDAIRAIKLMVSFMADAVIEGRSLRKEEDEKKPKQAAKGSKKAQAAGQELTDADLLGEATLKKVAKAQAEAEAAEAVAALAAEAKALAEKEAEEAAETADEAPAEEAAEVEEAEKPEEKAAEEPAEEVAAPVVEKEPDEAKEEKKTTKKKTAAKKTTAKKTTTKKAEKEVTENDEKKKAPKKKATAKKTAAKKTAAKKTTTKKTTSKKKTDEKSEDDKK